MSEREHQNYDLVIVMLVVIVVMLVALEVV